jgi:Domain of unknown function (DUF4345)
MIRKNLHLIISTLIVASIAIVYGFEPNMVFDVSINSIDEANIYKAIMGLYLAFSMLWIIGVFQISLWKSATVSNIIFMLGLAFGRIISILLDGIPTTVFVVGTIGELVLGLFAYYQLKRQPNFN